MLVKILTENLTHDDLYILKSKGIDTNKLHDVNITYDDILNEYMIGFIDKNNEPIILLNNAKQQTFEPIVKEMTIKEIEKILGYYIKVVG